MSTLKPEVSSKDNSQGNPDGLITLVEYGDYQCPHCGHAYPIIKNIQEIFGDQLKFVFRNFPLQNIHQFAVPAAIATEASAKQNKFWEMHDIIFENQSLLHLNPFQQFAEQLNMDTAQFYDGCNDVDVLQKVENDFESGIRSGVNGTPTFFVNGLRYNRSWEQTELEIALFEIIDVLKQKK